MSDLFDAEYEARCDTFEGCRHEYRMSAYCGARVCDACGDHRGLERMLLRLVPVGR